MAFVAGIEVDLLHPSIEVDPEAEERTVAVIQASKDYKLESTVAKRVQCDVDEEGTSTSLPPLPQQPSNELQRQQSLLTLVSGSVSLCRICHTDSWVKEPLISPCRLITQ